MAVPNKLPRAYFKPRREIRVNPFKQTAPKTSTLTWGQAVARRSLWTGIWKDFAEDIRQVSKSTHLEATMDVWRHYKKQGRLTPEVAILTDGSPTRSMKNVKFGGNITIIEPATMDALYDGVVIAYQTIMNAARFKEPTGDYMNNIYVLADNTVEVPIEMFWTNRERLDQLFSGRDAPAFFTIINTMPYAARLERKHLPSGIFYAGWKAAYSAYGDQLATRFRYYTADAAPIGALQNTSKSYKRATVTSGCGPKASSSDRQTAINYSAGKPLSFPAVNIGQPGAFASGASPVIKSAIRKSV